MELHIQHTGLLTHLFFFYLTTKCGIEAPLALVGYLVINTLAWPLVNNNNILLAVWDLAVT